MSNSNLLQKSATMPGMHSTLGERLKEARAMREMTRTRLSELSRVGYSTIAEIENGGMKSTTKLHALAKALNVPDEWLATGSGPREHMSITETPPPAYIASHETRAGYVRFPLLEGYAGMGRGDYMGDYPEIVDWIEVTQEWATQKLPGIPYKAVRVITGRGPSMRGVFNDGDLVFVDSRVKEFVADAAYVFRWHGQVQIKRLQFVGKGKLRILSANPDYPPLDVPSAEVEIGGRAIAAWTLQDL